MSNTIQNNQAVNYQNPNVSTTPAPGANGSPRIRLDIDDLVQQVRGNINPGALTSATDLYLAHGESTSQAEQDGKQLLEDMRAFLADPKQGIKVENDLAKAGYSTGNARKIVEQIASGQSVAQPGDKNSDNAMSS